MRQHPDAWRVPSVNLIFFSAASVPCGKSEPRRHRGRRESQKSPGADVSRLTKVVWFDRFLPSEVLFQPPIKTERATVVPVAL